MTYEYILVLGSNLGNRSLNLTKAADELSKYHLKVQAATKIIETTAYLFKEQGPFLNQGILIETKYSPTELWETIQLIESRLGRVKTFRYGPRKVDIDIVWWSLGLYNDKELQIPHVHRFSRPWVRSFIGQLKPQAIDVVNKIKYTDTPSMGINTVADFIKKKEAGEKITILTCYDYTTASLLSKTSLDTVLVGDSLGNVIQGRSNTLSVSLRDMIYHGQCVRRGLKDTFLIIDMPFMSYKISRKQALKNARKVIQNTHCEAIKVEGTGVHLSFIKSIIDAGIPVMGHLGLETQMFLKIGGYKLQSKLSEEQEKLLEDANNLEKAGCFAVILEMVPETFASKLSSQLKIPVIGIGAGAGTDGQVLVLQDLLGMNPDFSPRFCRQYVNLAQEISKSVEQFCLDVRKSKFPSSDESF